MMAGAPEGDGTHQYIPVVVEQFNKDGQEICVPRTGRIIEDTATSQGLASSPDEEHRRKNRDAAQKCRDNKHKRIQALSEENQKLTSENTSFSHEISSLEKRMENMNTAYGEHLASCTLHGIERQDNVENRVNDSEENLSEK